MLRVAQVVSAILLLAVAPHEAAGKWTRLRSTNFLFIGDASEAQIRRTAQKLEQFREVMLRALPTAVAASPVPTIVVVFSTDRSFTPFKPQFRGKPVDVGGFFQAGDDVNYIAVNVERQELAFSTIFHEYSHFLVGNTVGVVPAWVGEGLAELYETFEERDGGKSAIIGIAPAHHVQLLRNASLIPLRDLIAVDHSSSVYNEGDRRGLFYAESWALMHYLVLGSEVRSTQLGRYVGGLRTGKQPDQAFNEAFDGDVSVLEKELREYVRNLTFKAIRFNFPEKVVGQAIQRGEALDEAEAETYLGDLLGRMDRTDDARQRLQNVLAKNPKAARAASALGLLELRADRLNEAMALLERAAAQSPDDGAVQSALGKALIEHGFAGREDRERATGTLVRARGVLSRAIESEPNLVNTIGMLGYVELALGTDLDKAASLLERAARLAPGREQYRLWLAEVHLRQREYERATSYLGPLVATASSPEIRAHARRLLGTVANQRLQPAAAEGAAPTAASAVDPLHPPASGVGRGPEPVPILRAVKEGETRVLGMLRSIDCGADLIVLVIEFEGKAVRLGLKRFDDVEFISYRSEPPGAVTCGPVKPPQRVLATFRAKQPGERGAARDGEAVAIELLPDGFTPP